MKKFDRLPPEQRRAEIRSAALRLFNEKGFAATTMENIVSEVSLSKGGVYRLYPSTAAILADLMLEGMRMRNAWYADRVQTELIAHRPLTPDFLVDMIGESLLLYPDFSAAYVEFLWEKRRNPALEAQYQEVRAASVAETADLIRRCGAEALLEGEVLNQLTELMNAAILSLRVLDLEDWFTTHRDRLRSAVLQLLTPENNN